MIDNTQESAGLFYGVRRGASHTRRPPGDIYSIERWPDEELHALAESVELKMPSGKLIEYFACYCDLQLEFLRKALPNGEENETWEILLPPFRGIGILPLARFWDDNGNAPILHLALVDINLDGDYSCIQHLTVSLNPTENDLEIDVVNDILDAIIDSYLEAISYSP